MRSQMHIEKRGGLVISDWYFGERMETNSAGEKGKKCYELTCRSIFCRNNKLLEFLTDYCICFMVNF